MVNRVFKEELTEKELKSKIRKLEMESKSKKTDVI